MKRFVTLVLAASLVLVVPACGDNTDEVTRAAGIIPVDALAMVSLNLDPSIEQKRNLLSIARRFPDARDEVKGEFDESRDDLIAQLLEETGLDFNNDVKPWLGNEVAVAVLPPGEGEAPLIVALVETDDDAKARAAIDKATRSGDFDGVYTVIEKFVVISDQEAQADDQLALDLVAAEAKKDDGGLAESKAFTEVVDKLAGDRLLLGWVDVKESMALAEDFGSLRGLTERFAEDASTLALDLHADDAALVFQGVAITSGEAKGTPAEFTRSLPQNTMAALTLFNIGDGITDGLEAFTGMGAGDLVGEFESETGLNLSEDILSWMQGELVVVAGDVPEGRDFPDFGLVVEPSDQAKAQAGVEKIRQVLADRGFVMEERQIAGTTAYVSPEPLVPGIQPAMALFPDRFVLASRAEYMTELAESDSPGLAGTDAYKSVMGDDGSDNTSMQFVALLDPIREAIENAFLQDGEDKAEYDAELKPNLEPLSAFGIVGRREGNLSRVEMKLTFD